MNCCAAPLAAAAPILAAATFLVVLTRDRWPSPAYLQALRDDVDQVLADYVRAAHHHRGCPVSLGPVGAPALEETPLPRHVLASFARIRSALADVEACEAPALDEHYARLRA